ncbi:beta-1,3-galactosyl-O-glycosyl-glycoprotein beta-1,6-N-acetylglucosaminyltransferase 4-like [Scleropages formosus]|uniref:Beta-1,3-galactosyl-O-glycosyl-glycoprotein beta-1,6-N-acetylglucosaminyltransferase 4-like n=2 Tax=Scleropages formosus TaxID=113540 RepID=A0A0P7UDF5_SCLFO|nr:beta-1,3-galactosyl-O-glycosyl-glycoprotein beta-1,6-N-acetylglucosaminyltransferase 4-like [Scleropages formosus]
MKIRCSSAGRRLYKPLIFTASLLVVFLLKFVYVKVTLRNSYFIEPCGIVSAFSKFQNTKYNINCTAVYELDPVEVGKSLEIRRKYIVDLGDEDIEVLTSDCWKFTEARGYPKQPSSEEERLFPLAYSLVVHKHASMVERILRAIYMPQNIYCIHYDKKSSPGFVAALKSLVKCFPNVFIASKLEVVQYANITRLMADLNCLSDLLQSTVTWKYVINLCGQDFPLKSNFELVRELKALRGGNMLESSRPSQYKKQRFQFQHILKGASYEYRKLPVKTTKAKEQPPHNIEVFTGSAYFVLSHVFVSYINGNPVVEDLLAWSVDTYSPDEHFWATLARLPGVPGEIPRSAPDVTDLKSKTRLVKWSYLEGSSYPPCTGTHLRSVCIYGAAELRWLLNYGHWFANKVDPKVDPVVIKCLEEHLVEKERRLVNSRLRSNHSQLSLVPQFVWL